MFLRHRCHKMPLTHPQWESGSRPNTSRFRPFISYGSIVYPLWINRLQRLSVTSCELAADLLPTSNRKAKACSLSVGHVRTGFPLSDRCRCRCYVHENTAAYSGEPAADCVLHTVCNYLYAFICQLISLYPSNGNIVLQILFYLSG